MYSSSAYTSSAAHSLITQELSSSSSATTNNATYACDDERYYGRVEDIITLYGFGAVFAVGTLGNLVSLVVLQHKEFRLTSMRFTLSALAVVDTGLLMFGLLRQWLWELMDADPRSQNRFLCKTMYFGVYFFGQLSPWTIVLLTLERVVSIYMPLKAKTVCSTRRVVLSWVAMTSVLFAINSHLLWRSDLRDISYTYYTDDAEQYDQCKEEEEGEGDGAGVKDSPPNGTLITERRCLTCDSWDSLSYYAWLWIDLVLACFLPSAIILLGNTIIAVKLCRVKMERLNMRGKGPCKEQPHCGTNLMLISVSFWFLLTTSPLQLFLLFAEPDNSSYMDVQLAVCNLFYYLSSSTNFVLYCLTGSIFRKAFVATFRRSGSTNSLRHNSASSAHASFRIRTDLPVRAALLSHTNKVDIPLDSYEMGSLRRHCTAFNPSLTSLPFADKSSSLED